MFSSRPSKKLTYAATDLLSLASFVASSAVLWDGAANKVVLCFAPISKQECWTLEELQAIEQSVYCTNSADSFQSKSTCWSDFCTGWLGYFSYEAGHSALLTETRLPQQPLAEFFEYEFSVHIDMQENSCVLVGRCAEVLERAEALIANEFARFDKNLIPQNNNLHWQGAWNKESYQQAFEQVQAYLQAGDCYQVNLAMPFRCAADVRNHSPIPLLQSFNPAFGGYFKSTHLSLFSVSPERFISISGDRLETRPIKGTVARGQTTTEDEANKTWLATSAKNQAENLMIVDLLRNDLSRYALPHSVKVDKLFAIESHANVHHMVSTISATKREDVSAAQVIIDALPGGSITGAPKKRAMEVIDELETAPRGPYCGVLGYFDDAGFADFNILIRTIVATKDGAECWAGGGVVLDSTCDEEWQELHTKVARILQEFC